MAKPRIEGRVAAKIRALRQSAKLSQARLAEAARIEPETISRYEREKLVPSLGALERIAEALGLDPADLLKDEPQGKRSRRAAKDPELSRIVARLEGLPQSELKRIAKVLDLFLKGPQL